MIQFHDGCVDRPKIYKLRVKFASAKKLPRKIEFASAFASALPNAEVIRQGCSMQG